MTLATDAHATYDADGLSEQQIRDQVHRVASGIARIIPAAQVQFGETAAAPT